MTDKITNDTRQFWYWACFIQIVSCRLEVLCRNIRHSNKVQVQTSANLRLLPADFLCVHLGPYNAKLLHCRLINIIPNATTQINIVLQRWWIFGIMIIEDNCGHKSSTKICYKFLDMRFMSRQCSSLALWGPSRAQKNPQCKSQFLDGGH
jgi:hypothetical protein